MNDKKEFQKYHTCPQMDNGAFIGTIIKFEGYWYKVENHVNHILEDSKCPYCRRLLK